MEGIHELFQRWHAGDQERYAVATLLAVKGHSYRKPGALMLFGSDGPAAGVLSPGCLEADLAEHARAVIESGHAATVTYDLDETEDPVWGEPAFCGGSVTVLLEPLEGELKEALLQLRYWIDQGKEVVFNRILDHRGRVQAYRLIEEGGTSKRFGRVVRSYWTWSARYGPKPRILLFGGGPERLPVAELAVQSGFQAVLADWRERSGGPEQEAADISRVLAPVTELIDAVKPGPRDRVLLLSHHYQHDRSLLEQLVALPVRYIGILGSRMRVSRLLENLAAPEDPRIHGPVGLAIGAEGPMQIAVSIVAELIADAASEARSGTAGGIRDGRQTRRSVGDRQMLRSCPVKDVK
ncbi:XdhC family protein [Gorillibacterium sp. sgz5001074]|uniref:XdhC family protein n=1 Tax=Gorillibacterium sp. sgz5001074 TaxID=3446695 RepID=UPI003F678956